jgi:Cd2+/Zn2+-exporting ATPase
MLTGDKKATASVVGDRISIDEVVSDLMPSEKVDYIKNLRSKGLTVAMIGDGINDAPALATADVGIAMGLTGTDVTIETAGITLATDDLKKLPKLLRISRATMKIIKQNIVFAMAVNLIGVLLSVFGFMQPLIAAAIHESNSLIVVINSLRLLKVD